MASLHWLKVIAVGVLAVSFAFSVPYLSDFSAALLTFVPNFPFPDFPLPIPYRSTADTSSFTCQPHTYRTQLISLDPLVIYIHSFLAAPEITSLLAAAEPNFAPSLVNKGPEGLGGSTKVQTGDRTSLSAGLPRGDDGDEGSAVECVLARAAHFMGTMLRDEWDDMGPPQLVRYAAGQRFNLHHDWYEVPRVAADGSRRTWNRIASFFAVLQDNCTGGETHFPYIHGIAGPNPWATDEQDGSGSGSGSGSDARGMAPLWRQHEEGGLAFRPVKGNAVFWVNLFANRSGDERVMHAGLPLEEGLKTAMNIWPRQYYRA